MTPRGTPDSMTVCLFATRDALRAWRDDSTHRSVWKHAPSIYESFWIQCGDVFRQYSWKDGARVTGEDMTQRFAGDDANVVDQRD